MASRYNIFIKQRAGLDVIVVLKDADKNVIDITGAHSKLQVREYAGAPDPALITKQTIGASIEIDGPNGKLTAHFLGTDTAPLTCKEYKYDWFIKMPDAEPMCIFEGNFVVDPSVTVDIS
jgi:hypothetical protein